MSYYKMQIGVSTMCSSVRTEMTASCLELLTSATLAPRRAASVRNVSLCILGEAVRADAMAAALKENFGQPFQASNARFLIQLLLAVLAQLDSTASAAKLLLSARLVLK
jgi:hypothetical protein